MMGIRKLHNVSVRVGLGLGLMVGWGGVQIQAGAAELRSNDSRATSWTTAIPLSQGEGIISVPAGVREMGFLGFGELSFAPTTIAIERQVGETWESEAPAPGDLLAAPREALTLGQFQKITVRKFQIDSSHGQTGQALRLRVRKDDQPVAFFDRVIVVSPAALSEVGGHETTGSTNIHSAELSMREVGDFGQALPTAIRDRRFTPAQIQAQKSSLVDPVLEGLTHELGWDELVAKAYPHDYQKIMLAGLHDSAPGFAYQNGQWFTTVPSRELGGDHREDRWFAPSLHIGSELIVPAPLSAHTEFVRSSAGKTFPQFRLVWEASGIRVRQTMASQNLRWGPAIVAHFELQGAPGTQVRLAFGAGRRPSVHYWSRPEDQGTPLTELALSPALRAVGSRQVVDAQGQLVISADQPMELVSQGLAEARIEFPLKFDSEGKAQVDLATPQRLLSDMRMPPELITSDFVRAQADFEQLWLQELGDGAQVELPSREWSARVDSWISQVRAIALINGRLNYGAYYYTMYFGIEEGWPVVAMAQWGRMAEARAEAEAMLSPGYLDKRDYHHQYRNGLSSWYALEVARLSGDRGWLSKIAPTLLTNARWTETARHLGETERSEITRGLLPRHIYGGDISTPAYSIYANATCWRGLNETAAAFRLLGPEHQSEADELTAEADNYHARLREVFGQVLNRATTPAFLPLSLEIAGVDGAPVTPAEQPYPILTADFLGNYWNLFAPLTLHLGLLDERDTFMPTHWLTDYLEQHGGLWAGQPRFASGLDAVYAIGYVHELLERSERDPHARPKALAALESYMIHAASLNGYAVPEVSGLFDSRLDWAQYERATRGAPWMLGVYDGWLYLQGQIPITEPLAAGAGEGLWLIRKALVAEARGIDGLPDGELRFLANVPANWLREGERIRLRDMPTAYGLVSLEVKSFIDSRQQIEVTYTLAERAAEGAPTSAIKDVTIRLAHPRGIKPRPDVQAETSYDMADEITVRLRPAQSGQTVIVNF